MKTLLPPASEPPASCLKKAHYSLLITHYSLLITYDSFHETSEYLRSYSI
ncbi:MAG: hypothetical protein F6K47_00605 [Symploca sp. SIO2E6]|nr:hypothetical protein [Symploca sp. SIO2E6]